MLFKTKIFLSKQAMFSFLFFQTIAMLSTPEINE